MPKALAIVVWLTNADQIKKSADRGLGPSRRSLATDALYLCLGNLQRQQGWQTRGVLRAWLPCLSSLRVLAVIGPRLHLTA